MGSGFLFESSKVLTRELILIMEGLNFITKGSKGFGFSHDVMGWKVG